MYHSHKIQFIMYFQNNRYQNPINTVEDLVNSHLFWGATSNAWILSIKEAKEVNIIILIVLFKEKI